MKHYVYILRSTRSDRLYVGETSNYKQRLAHHNNGAFDKWSKNFGPWEFLVVFEVEGGRSESLRIETFLKAQKSRKFLTRIASMEQFTGKLSPLKPIKIDC